MGGAILVVEDEPAIQELIAVNLEHAGHQVFAGRERFGGRGACPRGPAGPRAPRLDASGPAGSELRAPAARRSAHQGYSDHHADRPRAGAGHDRRPGERRGRLRHQTVLAAGTLGAYQGGDAAPRPQLTDDVVEIADLKLDPVAHRVSAAGGQHRPRSDRVQDAAFLHDPSGARLQPRPTARRDLGRSCLCRGADRRRSHTPAAPGTGTHRNMIPWWRRSAEPVIASAHPDVGL